MSEADRLWREAWAAAVISFRYTNYRGETSMRRAVPISLSWRATEHHPEAQWILAAHDVDKKANRDFALKDCDFRTLLPAEDAPTETKHGERIDYTAAQLQAIGEAHAAAYGDALAERAVSDDRLVEMVADCEEVFNAAQAYRRCPLTNQEEVIAAYRSLIRAALSAMRGEP